MLFYGRQIFTNVQNFNLLKKQLTITISLTLV